LLPFFEADILFMSSKKAKAARKVAKTSTPVSPYENFGIPTGIKIHGKNINVALALYEADGIAESYRINTTEGFSVIHENPTLFGSLEEIIAAGLFEKDSAKFEGLALGIIFLADRSKIVDTGDRIYLDAETLPFRVGASRMWRNVKYGNLFFNEEAEEGEVAPRSDDFYKTLFPAFKEIYKIEQVISPEPISDSQDALLDARIGVILGSNNGINVV
jgi:hypothetical protein